MLEAARRLFTTHGYAGTTIAAVAAEAGVAVDTVYAAVGAKPVLFRLLLETAISGTDDAVVAQDRAYVQRIRDEIAIRRARNMRLLAQDLVATGDLRPGLTVEEIADVVWTMNSAEFFHLLVHERGWPPEEFQRWLADCWCRLFLADP